MPDTSTLDEKLREIAATFFDKLDRKVSAACMRNGGYISPADPSDIIELMRASHALGASTRAEGVEWRLVPVEPTRDMLNAAIDVDSFKLGDISPIGFRCSPQQLFERCYAAMLAAAPAPPTQKDGE